MSRYGGPADRLATWIYSVPAEKATREAFEDYVDELQERGEQLPQEALDDPQDWILSGNKLDDFQTWLDNMDGDQRERYQEEWISNYSDADTPASWDWFLHFTNSTFGRFGMGVPRDHVGQSGAFKGERDIKCPNNLTAPDDKMLWVHAFPVYTPHAHDDEVNYEMLNAGPGYGSNALLFQSDEVVLAKHLQSENWHALVLGCSEKNAIFLTDIDVVEDEESEWGSQTLAGTAQLSTGPVEFKDIRKLIEMLEEKKTSLGGFGRITNERSRWHRLARRY